MLICGITYFVQAGEKLLQPGVLNSSLDVISMIGVVLTMLVTIIGCWPVIKMKTKLKMNLCPEPESFLTNAMQTSFRNSWLATMVLLVLVLALQKPIDKLQLDTSFFLIILFGFMAASTGISFLYLTREDSDEDQE